MSAQFFEDPIVAGPRFIPSLTRHAAFVANGLIHGRGVDCYWYIVDPARHPLRVWRREPGLTYSRTASQLGAAVFTNGPMMGRRLVLGGKVTRRSVPVDLAICTLLGGAGGWLKARRFNTQGAAKHPRGSSVAAVVCGCASGVAMGYRRSFTGWSSCGAVHGLANGIHDGRSFAGEAPRHAWLGRFGDGFDSYEIGDGDVPTGATEGVGGLIRLVRDHRVVDTGPGGPQFDRDFHELADKTGVVAWGLAPAGGKRVSAGDPHGTVVVLGSSCLSAKEAAYALQAIGVRDAAATDQRQSVMMGHAATFTLPRPPILRQTMQTYGLYCG